MRGMKLLRGGFLMLGDHFMSIPAVALHVEAIGALVTSIEGLETFCDGLVDEVTVSRTSEFASDALG